MSANVCVLCANVCVLCAGVCVSAGQSHLLRVPADG